MFRNYNGHDASFGDTEVKASTNAPTETSVYASIDKATPSHVVIVAINKNLTATATTLHLHGVTDHHTAVYTLTSG